jgi:hypothetical protein
MLRTGPLLTSEIKNLTNAKLQSGHEEGISTFDHHFPQDDNDNTGLGNLIQNGSYSCNSVVNRTYDQHVLK